MKTTRTRWALVAIAACVGRLYGCSTESDPNGGTALPGMGSGSQAGRDASAGVSGNTGAGSTFGSGGGFTSLPSSGGSTDPGPDACAAFSQTPEEIVVYRDATVTDTVYDTVYDTLTDTIVTYEPVALYVMMDRSSSMVGLQGNPTSWPNATTALTNFVNDPLSTGLHVGLGVFPDLANVCGAAPASCCVTGQDCATPLVPIAELPGNGTSLIQGMQRATPSPDLLSATLTPTECALRGMIDHCIQHQNNTGQQCVAILVTDGQPTLCNGDPAHLTGIVANGLTQGILTFTLGLQGANINFLNQLAQAGGTDCDPNGPNFACDLTSGSGGLLDTLNTIRATVTTTVATTVPSRVASTVSSQVTTQTTISTKLDCQWGIPAPPEGESFDPTKVNLQVTDQNGTKTTFGYLDSADQCSAATGGWYYNDVSEPTDVLVCPDTCQILTGLTGARVDILFGCEREPAKFQ